MRAKRAAARAGTDRGLQRPRVAEREVLELLEFRQQALPLLGQQPPALAEDHPAADVLEHRAAALALEPLDLLADRGGSEAERLGGAGDRPVVAHRDQRAHRGEIEHVVRLPRIVQKI